MVKRYKKKFALTYHYVDEDGAEDIAFVANGRMLPLFKSMTGVELSDAINDYLASLRKITSENNLRALFKFTNEDNPDSKISIVQDNADDFLDMFKVALGAKVGDDGMDLVETILICARVCAMPEDDQKEALAIGTEILPDEIYQDPQFAFEILKLAIGYTEDAKKNSK